MSYKISVPIINQKVKEQGREALADCLRELDAERVFLALDCYETDAGLRAQALADLKKNAAYFHEQGFEVGAWIWAFMFKRAHEYTPVTMVTEKKVKDDSVACPTDAEFLKFSGEYIRDIATSGVDLIMFDDDLRFGVLTGGNIGCLCENHCRRIGERLGETLSREELVARILSGGENRYRNAWLAENAASLEEFADNARRYVDSVDPTIRMGACACLSSWDIDGTTASSLAKRLAGNTRPFVRLIGAPYWAARNSWGNSLQDVIEQERIEASWLGDMDIEVMAEGDTYPRPRITTPAAYLEGFDTAIRVSGCTDGILKYGIDYTSSPRYERGYIEYHKHNAKQLYGELNRFFGKGTPCGVRVYEFPRKVAKLETTQVENVIDAFQQSFFSNAARMLDSQAIPTTYTGKGVCGIAFGENARYLTEEDRKGGLILDGSAAAILHEQGIDVGIKSLGNRIRSVIEYFSEYDETVNTFGVPAFRHCFSEQIRVLSEGRQSGGFSLMGADDGETPVPMSYLYENAAGERYLVLNVDARIPERRKPEKKNYYLRQYVRGRQIADCVPWLSGGTALPAVCGGHPGLYMIAKEAEGDLLVGLWNFCADIVWEPVVRLGQDYRCLRLPEGGEGRLRGDRVCLGPIPAFGFAFFEVSR